MTDEVTNVEQQAAPEGEPAQVEAPSPSDLFKPPASQDELDAIITKRLERERAKYEGLREKAEKADSLAAQLDERAAEISSLRERIDGYEAAEQRAAMVREVATATGVDPSVINDLSGTSVEALTEQAERIRAVTGAPAPIPGQGRAPSNPPVDERREFARKLFKN